MLQILLAALLQVNFHFKSFYPFTLPSLIPFYAFNGFITLNIQTTAFVAGSMEMIKNSNLQQQLLLIRTQASLLHFIPLIVLAQEPRKLMSNHLFWAHLLNPKNTLLP
jgi:hypothetical protein